MWYEKKSTTEKNSLPKIWVGLVCPLLDFAMSIKQVFCLTKETITYKIYFVQQV